MASSGRNSNASQFFLTLSRCDHINKMHTIFGKVDIIDIWILCLDCYFEFYAIELVLMVLLLFKITGQTIYNLLKFNEIELDANDRPVDPPR